MASTRSALSRTDLLSRCTSCASFSVSFAMDSCVCSSSRSCHLSVFRWTPPPVSRGRASAERVLGSSSIADSLRARIDGRGGGR